MTPFVHSLALLVLAALVAASTPPAATPCPARLFGLQASAARNSTGHENLKAVLQQPEGAAWHLNVAAEEQRATGGERIRVTTFALSADAEAAGEVGKGALADLEAKVATLTRQVVEGSEELKASIALLQKQQDATVAELKANNAALSSRLEAATEIQPSRTTPTTTTSTRPMTTEERAVLSKKLLAAAEDRRVDEVRELLAQGAGTEERNAKDQETPLLWAAYNGDVETLQLLIDHGASLEARNQYQSTPLHLAASNAQCVEALLKAGADVNARGSGGWTPLHFAANGGHEAAVRLLLDAGADPGIKNNAGKTARDLTHTYSTRVLLPA